MDKLRLRLVKKIDDSYDIIIGNNIFQDIAEGLCSLKLGKIAIITDNNVNVLYGDKFLKLLKSKNLNSFMISFNAGEKNKTRKTKSKIEDVLASQGLGRGGLIIALGGGVVGDLSGFIASTYMRGISFIQIPTTLLAMVDSSIGGKTAVDTEKGKNMIGTFYQPKRVFIDINTLETLSDDEMLNGLAEIIKHAIIIDEKFFVFLEDYVSKILAKDNNVLVQAIKWSCNIKKKIVENDETEKSLRKILNFGHTIGHAIEKASNYQITHGEGVALGMVAETKIAFEMKKINEREMNKIISLIEKSGFNIKLSKIDIKEIYDNTKFDKKNKGGIPLYVLPTKIGRVEADLEVKEEVVLQVLGGMK